MRRGESLYVLLDTYHKSLQVWSLLILVRHSSRHFCVENARGGLGYLLQFGPINFLRALICGLSLLFSLLVLAFNISV